MSCYWGAAIEYADSVGGRILHCIILGVDGLFLRTSMNRWMEELHFQHERLMLLQIKGFQELLKILKKSANRYDVPELPYGCGIVDIQKAIDLIEAMQEE